MRCLIHFTADHHWRGFRVAELESLLSLYGVEPPYDITYPSSRTSNLFQQTIQYSKKNSKKDNAVKPDNKAFIIIELPNMDVINFICSRSVLIKNIYELYGNAFSLKEVIEQVKQIPINIFTPLLAESNSWSINVETFFKTISMSQKQCVRENFNFLNFLGKVNPVNPDVELCIICDYSSEPPGLEISSCPEVDSYFGRVLGYGGSNGGPMRAAMQKYDLKKRLFIGPTSLDHSLALIMSNLSGVQKNNFVLDPFVGTGSILIAATHFGSLCFGTDIDSRVLKGDMYAGKADTSKDTSKRDVFANFASYNLTRPELIRLDNHLLDRHIKLNSFEGNGFYHAIVTDPPYGIRAGARKSGSKKITYPIDPSRRHDHIPTTQGYDVNEVMLDLLHTAAKLLVLGGKLTYLIPTPYGFTGEDIPKHPCLELVLVCEQSLSCRHGRHCVVMKKVKPYDEMYQHEFNRYRDVILSGNDTSGFSTLMMRLEAALANDAFDNENVVKKLSNTSVKRKKSKIQRNLQYSKTIESIIEEDK
jgi:tRNA (guanine10-N2)-methyltransferase